MRSKRLSLNLALLGGSFSLIAMQPAGADVMFQLGNAQFVNVNIVTASNVPTCLGDIGNSGDTMTFQSMVGPNPPTQVNMQCEHGTSAVESFADSLPGATHTGFTEISLVAEPGTSWTAGDFALDYLAGASSVTFVAYDQTHTALPAQTLTINTSGQTKYNFSTSLGESITQIDIIEGADTIPTSGDVLEDVKQVSLEGHGIPEPATVALLGIGFLGLGFSRQRK